MFRLSNTQSTNTQNNNQFNALKAALSSEELQGLFTGQIAIEHRLMFTELMAVLSKGAEENRLTGKQDVACICNYNYYPVRLQEYEPGELEFYKLNKNEANVEIFKPISWIDKSVRNSCIEIVNHALDLSGYGEYLKRYEKELTKEHDICCSVNYYYDREGEVGFHQDSFGRELFVLLIYLDPVNGPEWKLQRPDIFNERINNIEVEEFMPGTFIETVKSMYAKALANKDVAENTQQATNIVEDVQWAGRLEEPGGIVGFVDELIIHSTPLIEHRQPNHESLLKILESKKQMDGNSEALQAIGFLEGKIKQIIEQEGEHYITMYELLPLIKKGENEEALATVLRELYNELWRLEGLRDGGDLQLGYSSHDMYGMGSTTHPTRNLQRTLSSEDILRKRKQGQSSSSTVEMPEEEQTQSNSSTVEMQEEKQGQTSSSTVETQEEKQGQGSSSTAETQERRRSFLRVWVTALPKKTGRNEM